MNAAADSLSVGVSQLGGGGFSWFGALGAVIAVLALLSLCLRLLGRLQRPGSGLADLLRVEPLGLRRELQIVRLGDRVHYVYRCEGGLVRLGEDSLVDYEAVRAAAPAPLSGLVARLLGRRGDDSS